MHWSDTQEIVTSLEETYSDEEIPEYDLSYLKEMILNLSDFDDHEVEVSDDVLNHILEGWLELRNEK
ncbi:Fe-S cluster assembly protein IscX [Rickettsiaceae bacterium]|jgi:FeS assembly protein IscX|nr:Fe-S cluster assembly protein IscX [Rickettsiaceae bacterium]